MTPKQTNHPCFSREAHKKYGRIHLPIAPKCNIQCRYCDRKYDCVNESRPGVTSRVLSPEEVIYRLEAIVRKDERIKVVGVAGPGDALANEETFVTISYITKHYPDLIPCLSTNGVRLLDSLDRLLKIGIKYLTITINAVTADCAEKIYKWAKIDGNLLIGRKASEEIIRLQWTGLREAIKADFKIKVNVVLIPNVNEDEVEEIAKISGKLGVESMNIIPLIPQGEFSKLSCPKPSSIGKLRLLCSQHINQMSHCQQCRSDACGKLGENRDIELETLNSMIGEEYCEMIL